MRTPFSRPSLAEAVARLVLRRNKLTESIDATERGRCANAVRLQNATKLIPTKIDLNFVGARVNNEIARAFSTRPVVRRVYFAGHDVSNYSDCYLARR